LQPYPQAFDLSLPGVAAVKKKVRRLTPHPELVNIKFYEDPMEPLTIW
jgi:hypothetical protein